MPAAYLQEKGPYEYLLGRLPLAPPDPALQKSIRWRALGQCAMCWLPTCRKMGHMRNRVPFRMKTGRFLQKRGAYAKVPPASEPGLFHPPSSGARAFVRNGARARICPLFLHLAADFHSKRPRARICPRFLHCGGRPHVRASRPFRTGPPAHLRGSQPRPFVRIRPGLLMPPFSASRRSRPLRSKLSRCSSQGMHDRIN